MELTEVEWRTEAPFLPCSSGAVEVEAEDRQVRASFQNGKDVGMVDEWASVAGVLASEIENAQKRPCTGDVRRVFWCQLDILLGVESQDLHILQVK